MSVSNTPIAVRVRNRLGLDRTQFLWGLLLVDVQILLAATYPMYANVQSVRPFNLVFPIVWIDVGLWAIVTTDVPEVSKRARYLALGIGAGYFLLLGYVGGVFSLGHAFHGHAHDFGLSVSWPLPPGWGPTIVWAGEWVGLTLTPYKLVGYAALAYLVYATVMDAAGSAVAGVVGLFSCVSCTWPILGTITTTALGSASTVFVLGYNVSYYLSAVPGFVIRNAYLLSTVVFLTSVALLKWRPGFDRLS